ncbi:hypothetical protein [Hydrogenophaga sp. SL48]|uniref:hypothetical protein n=1 Tax=Hydrogenophaga sp. SL48 TaxID=2806347 RepID=UPI001F2A5508|nr:hypothetical protein [Hydrogenophaga sp. SL48]UJW81275.1 hypothetical protein IM738_00565 [Hydrogenophaga sp. SL48]
MIALCAACHDQVHRGRLAISDETLYRWKRLDHPRDRHWAAINAEPKVQPIPLRLGPFSINSDVEAAGLIQLGGANWLTLRVLEGGIVLVDSKLLNAAGEEILRVTRSQVVMRKNPAVKFESAPGRVLITVPVESDFIPPWVMINFARVQDSFVRHDGRVAALDIEVMEPGIVRVEGYWLSRYHAAAITPKAISIASYSTHGPITLQQIGEGAPPILGGKSLREDKGFISLGASLGQGFGRSIREANVADNAICTLVFEDLSKATLSYKGRLRVAVSPPLTFSFFFVGTRRHASTLADRFRETVVSATKTPDGWTLTFQDTSVLNFQR